VTRRSRWPLLAGLVLSILGLSALWYANREGTGAEVPAHGGRYVEAVVGSPWRVNPLYIAFNDVDKDLASLVFSGLTKIAPDGRPLPDLAEMWEVSADSRIYTFYLREDVTWHDGAPFTADDVIFTWEALRDPEFKGEPSLGQFWQQVECTKLDRFTVRCDLSQPFSPFPVYASIGVLPQHRLEDLSAEGLFVSPFNELPIGTGPFMLKDLNDDRAVLRSNPTYHLGRPFIDEIELRFFADYPQAMAAIGQGGAQGLLLAPEASAEDLLQLQGIDELNQFASRRNSYTILFLNTRVQTLQDKWVRQAMLYALDRERLVADIMEGRAEPADSPIVPGTWAYSADVRQYSYDPQRARSLLEEQGWEPNSRGVMEKDGLELRLTLLADTDASRVAIGQRIAEYLQAIGVDASVEPQGGTALVQDYILPRRFEAVVYGWDQAPDPDPYPAWHSSQVREQGLNLSGYSHYRLDRVLSEARQTSDIERRMVLYREFQQVFAEQVPSIPLFYPIYNYFVDKTVQGIGPGVFFDPCSRFSNVHEWYVKTRRL
jgi:peptide/nickel transport system substrate-binding protein